MHLKSPEKSGSLRNELFIAGVTRTGVFTRMTLQDQIISLSRLVEMFQRDYGYMPQRPVKVLTQLNDKLNRKILNGLSTMKP